jgi:CheY-like chemotaxis protein
MKKNILLVDDDYIFNFLNQQVLQRMGIANEIYTAINGKEALTLFTPMAGNPGITPDVILLDLNMPIMDGFAFLDAMKTADIPGKENIAIIIVSSSQNPEDVKRAMDRGVDHYLTKPLAVADLRNILDNIDHEVERS